MKNFPIPEAALARHIACVGETGSGKTHDTKVIAEHLVGEGYRVCVLDTIKSDWWGITSSASGKRPGLPFRIIGGPRGHVPLHAGAGKAIGELVAKGKLPLSIIDMADFGMGDQQSFFVDFAEALWKNIRGVLYLVIEEAHEIAPKERVGAGKENIAVFWAKRLATGSRTKGIRLIVATQRTQALHNAVLGSCGTLVAHSLSFPADQKPVIDWLNNNIKDKAVRTAISDEMASLPTGTAWVACPKDGFIERVTFQPIKTFDNSATPDKDAADIHVATAAVDPEELRAILGDAVREAEANDPALLKVALAKVQAELAKLRRLPAPAVPAPKRDMTDQKAHEAEVNAAYGTGWDTGWAAGCGQGYIDGMKRAAAVLSGLTGSKEAQMKLWQDYTAPPSQYAARRGNAPKASSKGPSSTSSVPFVPSKPATAAPPPPKMDGLTPPQARIMASLAFWTSIGQPDPTREQVAAVAGYRPGSGNFNNLVGGLSSASHTQTPSPGRLKLLTHYPSLTAQEAKDRFWSIFDNPQRRLVEAAMAYNGPMMRDQLATDAGYSAGSGNFNNICGSLTSVDVLQRPAQGRIQISAWAREVLA